MRGDMGHGIDEVEWLVHSGRRGEKRGGKEGM